MGLYLDDRPHHIYWLSDEFYIRPLFKSHNLKAIITMLKIFEAYDIPTITIQTIALTYKDTFAKVTSPGRNTELIEIKKGLLQGDK